MDKVLVYTLSDSVGGIEAVSYTHLKSYDTALTFLKITEPPKLMSKQEYRLENTKVMEENTMQQTDEIEIDLWEICLVLVHNLALIVSVGIMTALGTFLITQLFITPKYESTTKIYILNKQENNAVTYSDIQLGTQLTKDYAEPVSYTHLLPT